MPTNDLALELANKVLSVDYRDKLAECILNSLMLVKESLLALCQALNDSRKCLECVLLLVFEVSNQLVLGIEGIEDEVFEVGIVVSQILGQRLVLCHQLLEAILLVTGSGLLIPLELGGQDLRDLDELLLLLYRDLSKFLILGHYFLRYLLNLCDEGFLIGPKRSNDRINFRDQCL